jgi:hypothetical protein
MAAIGAQLNDPKPKSEPKPQSRGGSHASAQQRLQPSSQRQQQQSQRGSRLSQRSASGSAVEADDLGDYIAAPAFSGPVLGFEFKSGPHGLGYYRIGFLKQTNASEPEQSRKVPSRLSVASTPSRVGSRPATSASSASLDSEWVFALNSMARSCEIRQQSRMSHRGGNVMTWAEPGSTLSPIGESATPSQPTDPDAPLGQTGKHPWQPRAPWNEQSVSSSTPKYGRRVIQPPTGSKGATQGLGAAGMMRAPATPGYGKLP